jgi:hypothetical protein
MNSQQTTRFVNCRRAVHALRSGSPADLRDPAVVAAIRGLHPDAERPALRGPPGCTNAHLDSAQ